MRDELRILKSLAGPFPPFEADLTPDEPRDLFSSWLRDAIEAGIKEPHAMVLSTIDEDGTPDARVLILKNLDQRGWHFATTGRGPKGRQIAANPSVALTFYWPQLGRQVRLRGMAFQAEAHERYADFRARTSGAKAVALTGRQSEVLGSSQELEDELALQHRRLQEEPDLVATGWALFIVMPHEVEFWQGDTERRHHRLRYRREKAGWLKERLWP
ncbi:MULTISPECIES: pyridoxal 5'-phosphate synthase [unclassified Rhizobium]|uniref:pyridoxine/pyridoxamine 5'-phosphate oxidase n=1 Tax=unclassified Rhizobium TaxID=2613769 RepID=UPI000646A24F|nr:MULTISPECIES: pyridoxal 5'-phosphate synthase [unclassified Rhizobium]MBN8953947.1 pyridoxal 5'-phosphate synthase [Rhizobium tropici]OJY72204.1 MAG: pyridoxamine 5'-phosphate oxidase [Rhizobium sp. 60-20]RKD50947.1 pyridoxamine 5'-phosphate oxidase [Rhizobium sp. WW_1]